MSNIQIRLTRDSVCMADDIQDHTEIIDIALSRDILSVVMSIAKAYLPRIAGVGHTWDCLLNNEKIAVIDGNCRNITSSAGAVSFSNKNNLYFKYYSATY